jgi:hypothetical protein
MTLEEILEQAPDAIKALPQEAQNRWAQIQLQKYTLAAARDEKARAEAETLTSIVAATKADAFVQSFISMTPQQVSDYVAANTDNLAQTRALMEKMALMLLVLARREFR